jgi:hypothetical protein
MALSINIALNDKTGGTVATGTIVKFETVFPRTGGTMNFGLFCYKSQADYDAGKAPYVPEEITNFSPSYTLVGGDYDSLTPAVVHAKLKDILEAMPGIGSGNVSVVA